MLFYCPAEVAGEYKRWHNGVHSYAEFCYLGRECYGQSQYTCFAGVVGWRKAFGPASRRLGAYVYDAAAYSTRQYAVGKLTDQTLLGQIAVEDSDSLVRSRAVKRLKNTMLPALDKPAAALIADLAESGRLDETLVVFITDFGRTPKINGSAGRDHYPHAYSVVLAGGGIRGGQVYGSSDSLGAHPHNLPCRPNDLHATIFRALAIPPDSYLTDNLGRPLPITDGQPLPLF